MKEKRCAYGVSQTRLAIMANISREHLSRIEAGKVTLTEDMKHTLLEAVEKFNPNNPMFLLFDYVRIRFPTMDIKHIIKDILKLN
ncbi:helix-turn-helix domain-containing protein, partial [Clostridioides difficile]|uniref:helix-turn-helix domain-containing protein n=2 Tax=Clostridioides difficile TaxID=1496 RepID=UPI00129C3063